MKKILIPLLVLTILAPVAAVPSIEEIMDNFEKVIRVPSLTGTFTVRMISTRGDVREIQATAYQQASDDQQMNRLFVFDYPPTVRDTALLIHSSFDESKENMMWIYLPAVRRIKRIALEQSGGGYFMGSDFTYADFIMKNRDDYTREYLGTKTIDGRDCYMVKDWAESLEQRQEMGYAFMINYYGVEDYFLYARDYFDLSEKLLKTYRVKEILDGKSFIYPTVVEMRNVQTDHRSIIEVSNYSTDRIPENYFSTRYLKNR